MRGIIIVRLNNTHYIFHGNKGTIGGAEADKMKIRIIFYKNIGSVSELFRLSV